MECQQGIERWYSEQSADDVIAFVEDLEERGLATPVMRRMAALLLAKELSEKMAMPQ